MTDPVAAALAALNLPDPREGAEDRAHRTSAAVNVASLPTPHLERLIAAAVVELEGRRAREASREARVQAEGER